ncbi:PPOX class F420-dependent oxidoreductase [Amycolatopsis sp. NPDC059657]|uniref:PPOX class F420-dependent oxidoreductase n=1 Tax=Amycolatopsis sp. NPDC059657 TaxID=3346899 RepID=UPI00366B6645
MGFDERTRALLDGKNFATVATLDADGSPHTSLVWIGTDGDAVVFSSLAGRRKIRNLQRDPRISLTVSDKDNPYQSVDIRGTAELIEDPGKTLPATLSHKYLGQDPQPESEEKLRMIVRVTPDKITQFSV